MEEDEKWPQVHVTPLQDWLGKLGIKSAQKFQVMVPTLSECISQTMDPNEMTPKGGERGHDKV